VVGSVAARAKDRIAPPSWRVAVAASRLAAVACYDSSVRLLRWLKPSLIDRYILKEIVPFTLLGLVLFTFVLLLPQIAELMGFLVSRSADPVTVLRVFWNFLPHILALTIPMSVLLGILLAFGRMGSESELIALRASGVSPARLLRPVVAVALTATLVTFYITAVAYPNANRNYRDLISNLVASQAQTAIRARVFTDDLLPSGTLVLYASDVIASTGEWRDLFLKDMRDPRKPRIVLARGGRLVVDREAAEARLDLEQATVYSYEPTHSEIWEEHQFAKGQMALPFQDLMPARVEIFKGPREMTLGDLALAIAKAKREGAAPMRLAILKVEWHKRFSIAVTCLVFGLLGVGLSLGQKKEARSAAFGLSIAAIFVYYVSWRFGEQFAATAQLDPLPAMWAANILFGLLAVWLIARNQREAAFDPLDPARYLAWLPRIRRRTAPRPVAPPEENAVDSRAPGRRPMRVWSLLDGYVASSYAGHLLLTTAAFWSLTMLVEFMDLVDDIQQNHVAWSVLFKYLLFQSPDRLRLVLPVAFLVATLTTLGLMARRNEITAIKAGGISVYRLVVPIVTSAALGTLFLFGLGEFIVPYTNRVALREKDVVKGRAPRSMQQFGDRMVLGANGRFYELTSPGGTPDVLYNVRVYDVDPSTWTLEQCLFAERARWNRHGGFYDLEHGWRRVLNQGPVFRAFTSTRTREIEPPEYFRQEAASGDTLGFVELRGHIRTLAAMGMDVIRLEVDLHSKLALPAVAVVMALLGIPFAFVVGRRGALYGIGVALLLAIVYWSCVKIFEGLGVNALLTPALAMWAPNVLFAGAAVYLLLCLDT
jgi:LPS export ABC transporter permease LptF/LPS export ABC transporter permease LptG